MKRVGIPLILTFKLDADSQMRLDAWRQLYFPPERNHLKAHLTVYHQLPGQELVSIREALYQFAAEERPTPLSFDGLKHHQGFVGVTLASAELLMVKSRLDAVFKEKLRAQDRQGYRPHVTVTNLGSPDAAQRCRDHLLETFQAWEGTVVGMELFHYRHGPWELAETFFFSPPSH